MRLVGGRLRVPINGEGLRVLSYYEEANSRQLKQCRYQSQQQIWYIDKDVDINCSSTAAATVLDITCMASPHSWQLASMECGTQATYGNSIRARQSGNSSSSMAYVWFGVRGEGKLEALQAVISDGVASSEVPSDAREGTSCLHDAFCGVPVPGCCMLCDGMVGGIVRKKQVISSGVLALLSCGVCSRHGAVRCSCWYVWMSRQG